MESPIDNKNLKNNPTQTSYVSSIIFGLIFTVLGFIGWYYLLRPEEEFFPFEHSRLEIILIVLFFFVVGFWVGPAIDQRLARSKYQWVVLSALTAILIFVSGVGTGYILWGKNAAGSDDKAGEQGEQVTIPENVTRYDVPVDDDPSIGPANAEITIIEFSDFECPFCTKWQVEVWPEIQKAFPNQVRLVYRDFPLYGLHANAESAAEAANCAGDQDKYWEYHELLFAAESGLGASAFRDYAKELDLDEEAFDQCLEFGKYKNEVKADYDYATNLGVSSTPTFFINGIAVVGAQPFSVFEQIISQELAGELK